MLPPMRPRLLVLLLVSFGCAGATSARTPTAEAPLPSPREALQTRGAPSRGPADALVTLVEFSDFECPYCARAAAVLEQLGERFPDDLRLVFRHFPLSFHEDARPAHEAAVEVRAQGGDAAFWAFHDRIYATGDLSLAGLAAAAEAAGANPARVRRAIAAEAHAGTVDEDLAVGVSLGVTGTPTFLLNGRLVLGAPPPDVFAALIDQARAEAQALVASGVPRSEVSRRITEALGGPPPDPELAEPLAIPTGAPQQGPSTAPVVVHVFTDHPCVGCDAFHADLARLRRAFGGDLQVVHRAYPLEVHPSAALVAEALVAAYAAGGAAGHDALRAALRQAPPALSEAELVALAADARAELEAPVAAALAERRHRALVEADRQEARRLGLRVTPAVVIGRTVLPYGADFRALEAAAALALEAAAP